MASPSLESRPGFGHLFEPHVLSMRRWWRPHRVVMLVVALVLVALMIFNMDWHWLPQYGGALLMGVWRTVWLLVLSIVIGFFFAVLLGLAQAAGPRILAWPARGFCTLIRGTPLLLQLWFFYFGLGSLFPHIPAIRDSFLWTYLRQAWPFALLALTLSFAGYEGEVMRGAFAGVPRGELEAARAYGMSRMTALRRIWLPRAFYRVLPTLGGEVIMQLKSTPLVATITVVDIYGVISQVRQDTFLVYSPLIFLAFVYMCLTGILVMLVRMIESRIPVRGT